MCNPAALLVVSLIGTGVAAYGQYQAGQTEKDFANYEAAQGRADADAEKGAAQVEAERIRRAGQAALAETNAALAASGQSLGSAGALRINQRVAANTEEDAYFALLGGKDRSTRLQTQASLTQARGKAAAQGATFSAFATAAQGTSSAVSGYRTARKT